MIIPNIDYADRKMGELYGKIAAKTYFDLLLLDCCGYKNKKSNIS
ncbi:hypothetical protein CLSAP_54280 [Clostridium saccharoperbutylacetonicum]|nr:hypothetical protein [Clostridium sp. YIM B02555]AQR98077.1 hypothetical protein CLSAP_54280 [Clostridium saccharoperbutylacetonicum]NSB33970.1 hypothetical protein [Clostridium saccharoperbutylacetonicum]